MAGSKRVNYRALFELDDNIIGVGTGYKYVRGERTTNLAQIIFVKKKQTRDCLTRSNVIPTIINGMKTDVIEVGEVRLFGRTDYHRPAQPGMSIGHYKISAGTFGAVVKDKETGVSLILSNNHVLANITDGEDKRSKIGDPVLQPGRYDGGTDERVIGYLERFVPLYREIGRSKCKIAMAFTRHMNTILNWFKPDYQIQVVRKTPKVNYVDCAVARPVSIEVIRKEIYEIGALQGIKQPKLGMNVRKSGRSSGLTSGMILAVDVAMKVAVSETEQALFDDQFITEPMSLPGDSGSLVVTDDNLAVGLLFAGSEQITIVNKIDHVLDLLNITL